MESKKIMLLGASAMMATPMFGWSHCKNRETREFQRVASQYFRDMNKELKEETNRIVGLDNPKNKRKFDRTIKDIKKAAKEWWEEED